MFTKTEKKLSSAYVLDLIPTDFNSIVKTHKSQADLQHAFPPICAWDLSTSEYVVVECTEYTGSCADGGTKESTYHTRCEGGSPTFCEPCGSYCTVICRNCVVF